MNIMPGYHLPTLAYSHLIILQNSVAWWFGVTCFCWLCIIYQLQFHEWQCSSKSLFQKLKQYQQVLNMNITPGYPLPTLAYSHFVILQNSVWWFGVCFFLALPPLSTALFQVAELLNQSVDKQTHTHT
jgi:hypothetical protein